VQLLNGNGFAAIFDGPAYGGNASIVLALARPLSFDQIGCLIGAPSTDVCSVSWIGNSP
jgi:hypothetical protein